MEFTIDIPTLYLIILCSFVGICSLIYLFEFISDLYDMRKIYLYEKDLEKLKKLK